MSEAAFVMPAVEPEPYTEEAAPAEARQLHNEFFHVLLRGHTRRSTKLP